MTSINFLFASVFLLHFFLISGHSVTENKMPLSDEAEDCSFNGIELKGRVQFVDAFPDIKIQYVDAFPDIRVQFVDAFPDQCGRWQEVDAFPDFRVQVVDAFPDIKVQKVTAFPGVE